MIRIPWEMLEGFEHFASSEYCPPHYLLISQQFALRFPISVKSPMFVVFCCSCGYDSMTIPTISPFRSIRFPGPKSWTKKRSTVCPASSRPSTCWRRVLKKTASILVSHNGENMRELIFSLETHHFTSHGRRI